MRKFCETLGSIKTKRHTTIISNYKIALVFAIFEILYIRILYSNSEFSYGCLLRLIFYFDGPVHFQCIISILWSCNDCARIILTLADVQYACVYLYIYGKHLCMIWIAQFTKSSSLDLPMSIYTECSIEWNWLYTRIMQYNTK